MINIYKNINELIGFDNLPSNSFINADCFNVFPFIKDKSVDAIITDLPYGTTNCKWDSVLDLQKLWLQYKRIIKPNGVIILFGQTPFDKILGCSNLEWLKYEWIWEKTQATGHLNAKKMPMKAHENILVFYDKLPIYNPQKTTGHVRKVSTAIHKRNTSTGLIYGKCDDFIDYDSTERYPRSVQIFASDKQKENLHSTQKPLALLEMLVKTYTNENDLVLDNCMGSGTTNLASIKLNRNHIGIEKDTEIFNKAINRIKRYRND